MLLLLRFLRFYVFFQNTKSLDFLRFFAVFRTFSRTMHVVAGLARRKATLKVPVIERGVTSCFMF